MGALDPSSLESAVQVFPEFSDEVKKGPDAGTAGEDRQYALRRAAFTQELSNKTINAIEPHAGLVLARAASLSRWKLLVIILGALGGIATLTSLGIGKEEAARISAVITSIIAVLNGILDHFTKRYSSSEIQKAADLRKAGYGLSILKNQLDSAIVSGRSVEEIVSIMEQCNQVALDLSKRVDLMSTG